MPRRTPGFITKRPHRKSRAGCLMCKKKKVKCDEILPRCSYCTLRQLDCVYPEHKNDPPEVNPVVQKPQEYGYNIPVQEDFNSPIRKPLCLTPAVNTSSGQLTRLDLDFLHQYKHVTWRSMYVREDAVIDKINREWLPRAALSQSYLLYTILSISAAHRNSMHPSKEAQNAATFYRQKTFATYNKALQNITTDNYETLLFTALLLQLLVPPPDLPCEDKTMLEWLMTYLKMTQGLRTLAGLKWGSGIEKLVIFPMLKRELRILPPPPFLRFESEDPRLYAQEGPVGGTPEWPNPAATYCTSQIAPISAGVDMANLPFQPQALVGVEKENHPQPPKESEPPRPNAWSKPHAWRIPAPAFLPPPLMALLLSLITEETGPIDTHRSTLLPPLHALSPIFLSLYHFHLSPDFYIRTIVLPTFLTPEFMQLVKTQEPRAVIVMAWWFAFVVLIPNTWWAVGVVPRLLQAASNTVMRSDGGGDKKMLMSAVEGAFRVVRLAEKRGPEVGARSIFEKWEGVRWEDGGQAEGEELF